jgi:hypothetical protein
VTAPQWQLPVKLSSWVIIGLAGSSKTSSNICAVKN